MNLKAIFTMPIRLILTAYCFVLFAAIVLTMSKWVIPRSKKISANKREQIKYTLNIGQKHICFYLNTLSFCRLVQFNFIGTPMTSPGLIAGNHPSLLDFIVLIIDFPQAVCIYKPQAKKNLILSNYVQSVGYVEGMSGSKDDSKRILIECCNKLRAGHQIAFFPEGTRSKSATKVRKFRTTLFHSVIQEDLPIQPVALYCNPLFLGKNQSWLDFSSARNRMTISYLPPIHLNSLPAEEQTARGLAFAVRNAVQKELDRLDKQ
jgi:1-acyl-sn-glycerol-3-phosphate acyltransferase